MQVDQYICQLLLEHDCVIIPGLGGLVAQHEHAKVDIVKNRFEPQRKRISFNSQLQKSDGLLTKTIATGENISYEDAQNQVTTYVEKAKHVLKEKRLFDINGVGRLYRDAADRVRFEPSNGSTFLKSSFGLEPFYLEKNHHKTKKRVAPKSLPQAKQKRHNRKVIKLALAAVFLIPLFTYFIWILLATELFSRNGDFTYGDLNPFTKKVCPKYNVRSQDIDWGFPEIETQLPDLNKDFMQVKLLDDIKGPAITVRLREQELAPAVSTMVATNVPAAGFHVIVGCFSVKANAKQFVRRLRRRGYNATIIDYHRGLHRVSVAVYTSKSRARGALENIRQDIHQGAWVLYKS